jgi:hypothetical protein
MNEKHFRIEKLTNFTRIRHKIYPSLMFPPNARIRAGDLELKVISTNDKKDTITFQLVGVFLQPKDEPEKN